MSAAMSAARRRSEVRFFAPDSRVKIPETRPPLRRA